MVVEYGICCYINKQHHSEYHGISTATMMGKIAWGFWRLQGTRGKIRHVANARIVDGCNILNIIQYLSPRIQKPMSVLAPLPLMQQICKQNAMPSNTSYNMPILVARFPSPPVIILPWTRICATSNLLVVGHSQTHLFSHRWPQLPDPREGDLGHWNHLCPFACFTLFYWLVNILPFLGVGQSPIDQPIKMLTTTSWTNYPLCRY